MDDKNKELKKLKAFRFFNNFLVGVCAALAVYNLIAMVECLTSAEGSWSYGNYAQNLIVAIIFILVFCFLSKVIKRKTELVESGSADTTSFVNLIVMVAKDLFAKKK